MSNTNSAVPDYLLERFLLNELPKKKMKEISDKVENDPVLQAKLDELRKSNEEILAMFPAAEFAAKVNDRYKNAARLDQIEREIEPFDFGRWMRKWAYVAAPIAASLVVVIIVSLSNFTSTGNTIVIPGNSGNGGNGVTVIDENRIKGLTPYLNIYRKQGAKIVQLAERSIAEATDMLQISYVASGRPYGMIFSIDGNGVVTTHYPEFSSKPTTLAQQGETLLGKAYMLDDAPYFERFFFVTSDKPIDQDKVILAAEKLAVNMQIAMTDKLVLPAGLEQYSFILIKEGK
ncbi:MAG: hypothetical protein HPY53_15870 [Brevinematales bacterium]|nr:hypothetical protein [Brevinematales bacterium]